MMNTLYNLPRELLIKIFENDDYASICNNVNDCRKYKEFLKQKVEKLNLQISQIDSKEYKYMEENRRKIKVLLSGYFQSHPNFALSKIKETNMYILKERENYSLIIRINNFSMVYLLGSNISLSEITHDKDKCRFTYRTDLLYNALLNPKQHFNKEEHYYIKFFRQLIENNIFRELVNLVNISESFSKEQMYHSLRFF